MEKRVLIADDSLTIQKVVELTFADSNYRLTCVSNGRLALEKVREQAPDLILADVVMPEKNGYEVCEEIKRNPATASIPVVLLAGTFEPFDRDRAQRLGCDAIVSKPFDSRELFRKVEALIAARPQPAETPAPAPSVEPEAAAAPASAAPSPFDAGFAEEDFTGSIRTLRAGRGEPLANLYGPEDVESALEAFREVEPTARAAEWRPAAASTQEVPAARMTRESGARFADEGAEPDEAAERDEPLISIASDDSRTQRIDVSRFRRERTTDEVVEPLPPLPVEAPTEREGTRPAEIERLPEPARATAPVGAEARELTDSEIDRLAEKLAAKIVEKLSDRIVREVAWEVVPETAELVVRERLKELESGVD
jgi:CheY-like chemotaxis protein